MVIHLISNNNAPENFLINISCYFTSLTIGKQTFKSSDDIWINPRYQVGAGHSSINIRSGNFEELTKDMSQLGIWVIKMNATL